MDVIAIDWSGDATPAGQRRHIWVAVVRDGELSYLENGLTRQEVVDQLIASSHASKDLVVGLDFAFSFPAWFLRERGLVEIGELWDLVAAEGEQWLTECQPPFWGRPGTTKPVLSDHFRETDRACQPVGGISPKSVFQIGGAGAVGTGSIRGMPYLRQLRDAGFSVWPFDAPTLPMVVEIYPRALTGTVNKSDPDARRGFLAGWRLPALLLAKAEDSEDALDAAVSALVMSQNVDRLIGPAVTADPVAALEGTIWLPTSTLPPTRETSVEPDPEATEGVGGLTESGGNEIAAATEEEADTPVCASRDDVRHYLELSISHLPERLSSHLDRRPGVLAWPHDLGYYLYVPVDDDEYGDAAREGAPPEVLDLLRYAMGLDCALIDLRSDVDPVEDLPRFHINERIEPASTLPTPAVGPGWAPPAAQPPPPGWYPDPHRQATWRWWDGHQWTPHSSN